MRISKRKINLFKYGGRHRIWIKPYRKRMRIGLRNNFSNLEYDSTIMSTVVMQIPKYRIIERRGKLFIHYFTNEYKYK